MLFLWTALAAIPVGSPDIRCFPGSSHSLYFAIDRADCARVARVLNGSPEFRQHQTEFVCQSGEGNSNYYLGNNDDDTCSNDANAINTVAEVAQSTVSCDNNFDGWQRIKSEVDTEPSEEHKQACSAVIEVLNEIVRGAPADLMLSGDTCSGIFNGVWAYEGTTADGKNIYSRDTQEGMRYIYFDEDSDGDLEDAAVCAAVKNRWFIDHEKPSTTAVHDLDGDKYCYINAYTTNIASTTSLTPSTSTGWKVWCDGDLTSMTLTFTPICTSPPDYVYAWPESWTTVSTACGTGFARQRTEVESCLARGGCNCKNSSRREVKTETEEQEPCPTTTTMTETTTTAATITTTTLEENALRVGTFVEFLDGTHKGKIGVVNTLLKRATVTTCDGDSTGYVPLKNIKKISAATTETRQEKGSHVLFNYGKFKDITGTIDTITTSNGVTLITVLLETGAESEKLPIQCTTAFTTTTTSKTTTSFSCKDATDFIMCASKDQCISKKLVCDGGSPDCADGSDEQGCATTVATAIATTTARPTASSCPKGSESVFHQRYYIGCQMTRQEVYNVCLCPGSTSSCEGGCTESFLGCDHTRTELFYWQAGTCKNCKCIASTSSTTTTVATTKQPTKPTTTSAATPTTVSTTTTTTTTTVAGTTATSATATTVTSPTTPGASVDQSATTATTTATMYGSETTAVGRPNTGTPAAAGDAATFSSTVATAAAPANNTGTNATSAAGTISSNSTDDEDAEGVSGGVVALLVILSLIVVGLGIVWWYQNHDHKHGANAQQPTAAPHLPAHAISVVPNPAFDSSLLAGGHSAGIVSASTSTAAGATSGTPFSTKTATLHSQHFLDRTIAVHADSTLQRQQSPLADLDTVPTVPLYIAANSAAAHCGQFDFAEHIRKAQAFAEKILSKAANLELVLPPRMQAQDIAAIHLYTQESPMYRGLNGALGGWGIDGTDAVKHYLPYAKLLMAAFEKLPRFGGTLYRGVRQPLSAVLGGKKEGDTIEWWQFTSTTVTPDVLRGTQFLGMGDIGERVVFQIVGLSAVNIRLYSDAATTAATTSNRTRRNVSLGCCGHVGGNAEADAAESGKGDDSDEIGDVAGEDEAILLPGSRFVIHKITKCPYGVTEVQLRQLNPKVPQRRNLSTYSSLLAAEAYEWSDPAGVFGETHELFEDPSVYMVPGEDAFQPQVSPYEVDAATGDVYNSAEAPPSQQLYAVPMDDAPDEFALATAGVESVVVGGNDMVRNEHVTAAAGTIGVDGQPSSNIIYSIPMDETTVMSNNGSAGSGHDYVNKTAIAKAAAAAVASGSADANAEQNRNAKEAEHHHGAAASTGAHDYINKSAIVKAAAAAAAAATASSESSAITRGGNARASGQYGFDDGTGGNGGGSGANGGIRSGGKHAASVYNGFNEEEV